MPRIRVVTDSACDIPDSLLKQSDVTVVPLSIGWGTEMFLDRGSGSAAQVLQKYADGLVPEVFSPSVDELTRTYRSLRESCDGIISIHTSSKLVDATANASVAREVFSPVGHGGPFPIAVVDSMSMSMGLGWLVLAIARAAATGLDLAKLVALTNRLRGQTHVAFITGHMEGLLRNRAVPNMRANASSFSSLKPLFHVDEGQVSVYERTRTRIKARDALYNFVEDFPKIGDIAVFHIEAQNDLEHLMTRVGAIYPRDHVLIMQPGAAVTAWLGPEALGVAVFEGEE